MYLILIDMSSYDPDDHFKLSRTYVGHSEPELYNSAFARYAAMTFRYVTGELTLNFGSRTKKSLYYA